MDGIWDRVKQLGRLAGIVAIASASLALSYCSHTRTKSDSKVQDLQATPDAALDAGAPDTQQPPKPDARLWDVLCE